MSISRIALHLACCVWDLARGRCGRIQFHLAGILREIGRRESRCN